MMQLAKDKDLDAIMKIYKEAARKIYGGDRKPVSVETRTTPWELLEEDIKKKGAVPYVFTAEDGIFA